jgi:ribosomal-protein-alanine N-acetyltransferase
MDGAINIQAPKRIDGQVGYAVPFNERHLEDPEYLAWLHDDEVIRTLNLPAYWQPVPFDAVKAYCEGLWASQTDFFFAMHNNADDAFVGTLRVGHVNWAAGIADLGIMIGNRNYWGRGLAQDTIAALARWAFDDAGMRRLTAGAMAINPAMIRVFEKLGFQREGCLREQDPLREGGYCDHILLGCMRNEFRGTIN